MTAVFVPSNAAMIVQRLSWEEVRLSTLTESSLMIHSLEKRVSIYRCLNGLKAQIFIKTCQAIKEIPGVLLLPQLLSQQQTTVSSYQLGHIDLSR